MAKGGGEDQREGCRGWRSPAARLRWLGYDGQVEVEKRAIPIAELYIHFVDLHWGSHLVVFHKGL
jgi:hypothetical protein